MHTPREVIGNRFGRGFPARRKRRPVVEIDQGQLALGLDIDVDKLGGHTYIPAGIITPA